MNVKALRRALQSHCAAARQDSASVRVSRIKCAGDRRRDGRCCCDAARSNIMKRGRVIRTFAAAESGVSGEEQRRIREFSENLAQHGDRIIGSILEEVSNKTFFEDMQYGVSGHDADREACQSARDKALDEAIEQRKDTFDDKFLLSLEAYIGACTRAHYALGSGGSSGIDVDNINSDANQIGNLLETLKSIKAKVTDAVRKELPIEMQCIEFLHTIKDAGVRENTMAYALHIDSLFDASKPYLEDCPRVSLCDDVRRDSSRIQVTADCIQRVLNGINNLIEDMEKYEDVVDSVMLARLVILREDIRDHAVDETLMAKSEGLSRQDMAFLKELLSVDDRTKRIGIISEAFAGAGIMLMNGSGKRKSNYDGVSYSIESESESENSKQDLDSLTDMFSSKLARRSMRGESSREREEEYRNHISDKEREKLLKDLSSKPVGVRPGRFFDASRLMQTELQIENVKYGPQAPNDKSREAYQPLLNRIRKNEKFMERLSAIMNDSILVLQEIAGYT